MSTVTDPSRPTNRLAGETSPYLLQHQYNPVDWYPWGTDALEAARTTERPIFLSVGYAACHWCHVMERESFEDATTAADLNRWFVSIKVDREERPDIDAIYMDAVQALTGQGGWPMSVFLTPDGKPFFGGTYFPDQPRHGMPSFRQVLAGVNQAWAERRADVLQSADRLATAIGASQAGPAVTAARMAAQAAAQAAERAAKDAGTGTASTDTAHTAATPGTAGAARAGSPGAGTPTTSAALSNGHAPSTGQAIAGAGLVGPDGRPLGSGAALTRPSRAPVIAPATRTIPAAAPLVAAITGLARSFDQRNGGFGGAPKFPQPMATEFLLREALRTGDARPLAIAKKTLDAMAAGGIRDHLGGGFARYATDATWLVPHFEKMLYDNAQLARLYLHAWQMSGSSAYAGVVRETLDWALRELRVPPGGAFAAALDADTGGHEGATYLWDLDEVRVILGDSSPVVELAYGVTANGNWEGRTILSRARDDASIATTFGISREEAAALLEEDRARLLAVRDTRPQPARDDKVLASWNGLMLTALAEAGRLLPDGVRYRVAAEEAADFLLSALRGPDGRLRRSWKDGRALHAGTLEDHTHLAEGLLALYETTFDERWFTAARGLMDVVLDHFAAPDGGFFDTSDDAEALITRPRSLQDNALPSGNAMAATVLLRLSAWTGEGRYRSAAEAAVAPMATVGARHPTGFAQWLLAYQAAVVPVAEIAIVGEPGSPEVEALLAVTRRGHRPWQVVTVAADPAASAVPLLDGRSAIDGRATAYVCRSFACQQPVTNPAALATQLGIRTP